MTLGYACVQLPTPPSDERKKVVEDVDRDRRYQIDAAIVRTMKSRKVLQHQQVCPPACMHASARLISSNTCLALHADVLKQQCSAARTCILLLQPCRACIGSAGTCCMACKHSAAC